MDFRTVIAMILMVAIYFVFMMPRPEENSENPSGKSEKPNGVSESARTANSTPLKIGEEERQQLSPLKEKIYSLENSNLKIQLNALGEVQFVELKKYRLSPGSNENVFWDFNAIGGFNRSLLESAVGQPEWKFKSASSSEILLETTRSSLKFERKISLPEDTYLLHFEDQVFNSGSRAIDTRLQLEIKKPVDQDRASRSILNPYQDVQHLVWSQEGGFESTEFESILEKPKQVNDNIDWVGFSTRYFFLGLVPKNLSIDNIELSSVKSPNGEIIGHIHEKLDFFVRQIEPNSSEVLDYSLYLGPKKKEELYAASPSLDNVIDFSTLLGFLTKPISRFLLSLLIFFHSLIPNYGVAIILLTILVKLFLLPLAWKGALGMKKLALVQPRLQEIRKKYKKDPQRMQAETMRLWKEEKVNPVGGCLPILVQLPVFFALYPVFFVSIEMRHAHFFAWLDDLSTKDPYFILPAIITIVMFAQVRLQKDMTPGMDSATGPGGEHSPENEAIKIQKTMMKIMPLLMGVFSIFMPAGLSLYILVNIIFSVVQQKIFNKKLAEMFPKPIGTVLRQGNGS